MRGAGVAGGEPKSAGCGEGAHERPPGETGPGCRDLGGNWGTRGRPGLQPFAGGPRRRNKEQLLFSPCPSRWWCQPGAPACSPAPPAPRSPPPRRWLNHDSCSPLPRRPPPPAPRVWADAANVEPGSQVLLRTAGSLATESIIPSRWCSHGVMDITHDSLRQSRNSLVTRGPLYTK